MLTLTFKIGKNRYAISAKEVTEVLPVVHIRSLPQVPDYIEGTLNFHGTLVPVIDLSTLMTGNSCEELTSTRILLLYYPAASFPDRLIGLMVENATETIDINKEDFKEIVITTDSTPYLGKQAIVSGEVIQLIHLNDLLPEKVQSLLYPESV